MSLLPHSPLPVVVAEDGRLYPVREAGGNGVTLPREALSSAAIRALERGGVAAVTLRLDGPEGPVEGEVIVRLTGFTEAGAECTFVMVPTRLRRALDEAAVMESAVPEALPGSPSRLPEAFSLAFARLEEPLAPGRRLILQESTPVLALTRVRRFGVFSPPAPLRPPAPVPSQPPVAPDQEAREPARLSLLLLFVIGILALTLLGLIGLS